ncbi:hypothetical protein EYC80_008590 [Monilinia laxa]|uniref:Uncharacterized protein n=1 Tax=Monilinia laxa TaxID=61186 RepID=A0A5N6K0V4_MONLA|nr:hypothetical protein EYC80_008590 [Monilinia laxa]
MKNSTTRPMSNPLQTNKKEFRRKQKLNPTEPFPSFYSKKSPSPKNLNGRGTNPAFYGPLNSCPGIYIPEKFQKSKSRPGDSSKAQHLPPITESPRQYITNNHNSSTQPPEGHGSRCESCQPTDYRSFVCRHPTSPSLARSEDVLAMGGDYTSDNSNSENIYRSHSHPNSSKASQPSTRFYRLLNGSIHRATHLSHDSDGQDIPRTSTRSYKFATGPMQRKTHTSYERDLKDHTKKSRQTLVNSYPPLSKPTYQPVQPNFESDHTQDPQPSDSLYPFRNETISEVAQSEYGSDYVECRGYPRTGHWDCDRSPVSSGVLGDCQHCLDDFQKYDSISEWLGSPDGPSPQRLETTKITPTEAVQISKDNTFIAITKVNDSSATPPSWGPSLKPITPKSITPLMKKALNKTSKDASLKARANLNRASSSDGTKYHPIAPVRSSNRNSIQASPEYSASDSWREIEIINFSKRYDHWEKPSTSPLEQVSKNTTHCDISDVCGQSNWVEQRQKGPSNLRKGVKRRTELEKIQQKIHRWEDKKSESRRGRDTITATASEMTTPVSRGYFDAQMRWCSSESMQGRRGNGGIGFMGSIEEEEVEMESVENGEGYDCVWRRVIDLSDKGRGHGSRDEVKRGMEGIGGVKGVTIVIHMESGEDLVLRTNSGGKLNWEGLEGLLRVRSGA